MNPSLFPMYEILHSGGIFVIIIWDHGQRSRRYFRLSLESAFRKAHKEVDRLIQNRKDQS